MPAVSKKLRLHHAAPSRSSTTLWMLEELGEPYDLNVIDTKTEQQLQPAYRAINPMGKVPALEHEGQVITEVGAICLYLADAFPKSGLAPAIGDPMRGPYVRWMFFQGNCFEPAIIDKAMQREPGLRAMSPYGEFDMTVDVVAKAIKGPWFLGEKFTALDVYFGSAIRWTTQFGLLPSRPEFQSYIARLVERPAAKRAAARDAALATPKGS